MKGSAAENKKQGLKRDAIFTIARVLNLPRDEITRRLEISDHFKWFSAASENEKLSVKEKIPCPYHGFRKTVLRVVAAITLLTFVTSQMAVAEGTVVKDPIAASGQPALPVTDCPVVTKESGETPSALTATDFLASNSPLSPASVMASADPDKIYDGDGRLIKELQADGKAIRHVYAGASVQSTLDQSQTGDTVVLHEGVYHEHLTLRQGIVLKGEDPERTVVHGDYLKGSPVIRALGSNLIEGLTVTGGRDAVDQISAAVRVEGSGVKIRDSRIKMNLGAGVQVSSSAEDILIEQNIFFGNNVAIETSGSRTVIRYNTITGYEVEEDLRVKGFRYVRNRGFQIEIQDPQGAYSYHIEYSDDDGEHWRMSRVQVSPGVFEDQLFPANPAGNTFWLDDGSTTAPHPLSVTSRSYRVVLAESFQGRKGIVLGGTGISVVQSNIVAHQTEQPILEALAGTTRVEENSLFHNGDQDDGSALQLPSAIGSVTGEGWTNGNRLEDPKFLDPARGNYSVPETSPAFARGFYISKTLDVALARADSVGVANFVKPIMGDATLDGFRIFYEEGSTEEFYNDGRAVLDTTPPGIEVLSGPLFVNRPDFELVYSVEGIEKKESRQLTEGRNVFTLEAADIFGNTAVKNVTVTLDQTPPAGLLRINDGDEETGSRAVVLDVAVADAVPLKDLRFSLDGGEHWTDWETYNAMKVVLLPEGEGSKEVLCQVRDEAGNISGFSDVIRFVTAPIRPTVQFLSDGSTADPYYLFRYSVEGVEHQEFWRLQPGENRLMVCATAGTLQTFSEYSVMLNQSEAPLPAMPSVSGLPQNLVSLTAANGLVLKYQGSTLFAIEKKDEFTLFSPLFDEEQNLLGGVLLFANGDRLLYQNGKAVYRLSQAGEKTVYNGDGTAAYVLTADGKKIRFAYQLDDAGEVLSMLSFEEGVTSLYDEKGRPVWIRKTDGPAIFYQDGFLETYTDTAGNVFHYEVSILNQGSTLQGYRSELVSVECAGISAAVPLETVLADLANYPSVQKTLEQELSRTIEYGPAGDMKKVISIRGEILALENGSLVSFLNQAGDFLNIQSQIPGGQDLFSFASEAADFEQVYDAAGQLSGIRMSDGTFFRVSDSTLQQVRLNDGSVLEDLYWYGSTLMNFTRTYADGSKEICETRKIVRREDAEGNVTVYPGNNESLTSMEDGRTYYVSEGKNEQGVTERTTALVSVEIPGGGRVDFEYGKPVRYTQNKGVPADFVETPELLEGRFFVPLIQLTGAQLRSLTVDANGSIFSGELFFDDGTQYLIENDKIVKQVTASGQILEFSGETLTVPPPEPAVPAEPLTAAEASYRNELVEFQLDYFMNGKGIHEGTGLPLDNFIGSVSQQSDYSQATLIGFWAEILAAIAAGDYTTSKMSRSDAFAKLQELLETYQKVQQQAGWNGMVAFFKIIPYEENILDAYGKPTGQKRIAFRYESFSNQVGFGDTLNLSVSLASVIGALEDVPVAPEFSASRSQILASANAILAVQEAGYARFYDPVQKRFRGAYARDPQTGVWQPVGDYYIDRVFNEFRTGMVWLVTKYPQYAEALQNLDLAIRPFETSRGDAVDLAVPYDGGAFQMFWPLIHVDETQYPEFNAALRNFLYAQAEFAAAHGTPGLLSAGDVPGEGYDGKIGLPAGAETDDVLKTDIGSIYGTAAAFPLAPHYSLQFLKNLEAAFPGMRTSAGFVDAIQSGDGIAPVYSDQYYGVDQAAFILSLLRTSQDYFDRYLRITDAHQSFDSLYGGMSFKLNPLIAANPEPPDFGGSAARLYNGASASPDGLAAGLVKQPAFVPVLSDPEFGEGHIYNYLTVGGEFHHIEIEFGEGENLRRMNLQEYFLSPKHAGTATALLAGMEADVLDGADSQGVFYTPGKGFSRSMSTMDPLAGEVRRLSFNFISSEWPVGVWANYSGKDFSEYDFLSVPVKLGFETPEKVRLKFEFKGLGQIFVTEPLTHEWQYVSIPVPKSGDTLSQLAISMQPEDGQPVAGDVFLGPLSALKVRRSNTIDWELLLGKTGSDMQALIRGMISNQVAGGQGGTREEVLENFTIDASGKLINGVLKLADGGIQYFLNGQLVKWVFKNGRTVLFEDGLATFVIELARGKLEVGRFYYDKTLRGQIRSFVVQENDSKKVFGADGKLQTMVEEGAIVHFANGGISSIQTDGGTLLAPQFADDGTLLRADAVLDDGTSFRIDQSAAQGIDVGDGVKVFYENSRITAIEVPGNSKAYLMYQLSWDETDLLAVKVYFDEIVVDPVTGQSQTLFRSMSLSEFLLRPERSLEKKYLLKEPPLSAVPVADTVSGFSVGDLADGEVTQGEKGDFGVQALARYQFCYKSEYGAELGLSVKNGNVPADLSRYDFLGVTLKQDPSMDWNQQFLVMIKNGSGNPVASFSAGPLTRDYQTFVFPLQDISGFETEITLEAIRQGDGIGKTGAVYLKDLSFMAINKIVRPLWEDRLGITSGELQNLKIEADQLASVGAEVASADPIVYEQLVAWLDTPSLLHYSGASRDSLQLTDFTRFDGSQIQLMGQTVRRVILPDGTVNEYSAEQNTAQGTILGPGEASGGGTMNYTYGALRRITQADGRQYDLSFEFDPDGKEITVFKDARSGEERRFKDGKLLTAVNPDRIETRYSYQDGELLGAELTYNNRVLNSTQYLFRGKETQVTDERGTTWFYDANGNLIRHMTRDGFLYEYSDYVQEFSPGSTLPPEDYKNALFAGEGLRAVSLKGYESTDGSWILWDGAGKSEIHLASGTQGVNLTFDEEQRVRSGQIQFPDGLILEIENYVPVRGRLSNGEVFESLLPETAGGDLLQGQDGTWLGFSLKSGETTFTYNPAGELVKTEAANGVTHLFTYARDSQDEVTGYTDLERRQVSFNGVPFPKEVGLTAGADQKLMDSGVETAVHSGDGFLVGVYEEATNQWDVYSGSFSSEGGKLGLKHFLAGIKAGDSVAAVVSDPAFANAGNEILTFFEGLGAGGIREAAAHNSKWSFFGNESLETGQGAERTGADAFSTVTESTVTRSLVPGQEPLFGGMGMLLKIAHDIGQPYSEFLKAYAPLKAARDMQSVTVYDAQDRIVFSRRLDGISSYYEFGKVRETFGESGELLSVHEYACPAAGCRNEEDMTLSRITLVRSRQDFESEAQRLAEQIEQAKFDALYRLAWQDEVARAQVAENVDAGVAGINSQISSLESQRFQTVKHCRRILFWKSCEERTYEVPGVQDAINRLAGQRADLIHTGQDQLALIPGAMLAKQLEIEQATAGKMLELLEQKESFLLEILHQEMEPVLTDFYRRILGRDASTQERGAWVERSKVAGRLDIAELENELQSSPERTARENQKAVIVQGVREFLESYLAAAPEIKTEMLGTLHLGDSEAVALDAEEVAGILAWLESRDLHFGQSAFLSLKELLASQGSEVPMETLGRETILIDILTGTIHKFSEGDLVISMFALDRAAAIHARDVASVKYSYQDLLGLYRSACPDPQAACSLRAIAHVGEDHFVVVKRVTETEITYEETGKGANGEDVTSSRENFLKIWLVKENSGYLMVSEDRALAERKLSDQEAMRVRGSFFIIDDIIFWAFVASLVLTAASVVASFFSPTFGKILGYAAMVAGIIGIVASLGQFVVQGLKMVFSSISQNGIFGAVKQGIAYVGKALWTSVKSVGRFIMDGFEFLKGGFAGGFGSLGAGISKMKIFLLDPAQEIVKNGVVVGHKFTFAQNAARQLISAGLNFGIAKGLEGFGLDPVLCQLAGAFVG
ncbi:MAG TPA: hypothetical protein PLL75_06110, partial [Candidatus Omnitrophota bacterium]|nr:hypothetical protein [Candidatus Omnitrophota bacterium]